MHLIVLFIQAAIDTTAKSIPHATPTEYLTVDLVQFFASLIIMFLIASALLELVKVFSMRKRTRIIPNSTSNETVSVMEFALSDWLWFIFEFIGIALSIVLVRGMFGNPIKFNLFTQSGAQALVEIILALGLLFTVVPKWGLKVLDSLGNNIIKSRLSTGVGEVVVTPAEYLALGTTDKVNSPTIAPVPDEIVKGADKPPVS